MPLTLPQNRQLGRNTHPVFWTLTLSREGKKTQIRGELRIDRRSFALRSARQSLRPRRHRQEALAHFSAGVLLEGGGTIGKATASYGKMVGAARRFV